MRTVRAPCSHSLDMNLKEVGHCKQWMSINRKEQGPGAPLRGVTAALAWGVRRTPPSKFEHMSEPETLITRRVWQMGFPCIVSGTFY